MLRKELALAAIICTFCACNLRAEQWTLTWGPTPWGHWEENFIWGYWIEGTFHPELAWPENDQPAGITYVANIDSIIAGVDQITVGLEWTHVIDQLNCYGKVKLQNWSNGWVALWFSMSEPPIPPDANGLTNYGELSIDRIDISRGNVRNLTGAILELGEDLTIYGNIYNEIGATVIVYPDHIDVWGTEIQNEGTIVVFNGSLGEVETFHNSGKIGLYDGGCHGIVFNNDSNGVIEGFGYITADQTITNKGLIKASKGALRLFCDGSLNNAGTLKNDVGATLHIAGLIPIDDVNNEGTIEANGDGVVTFDCNLVNKPNATINLLGGTLAATTITQAADANFAGFGGITGDVSIDPNGLIQLTGPTNIVGDVEIDSNATLEISDGTTLITGHTTCNNGTIHMIGGRVICQGGLTNNNCNIIWEPGIYTNVADFNLDGTVNFKDFADFANTWLWQASWR